MSEKLTRADVREEIAAALRMLAEKWDRGGYSYASRTFEVAAEIESIVAARLTAAEPAPKVPSCRSCGDQWGLCDCGPTPEEQSASDPLPPPPEPRYLTPDSVGWVRVDAWWDERAAREASDANATGWMAKAAQWKQRHRIACERAEKAERALLRAGFTDNGGKEWKPPVNKDSFAPKWAEAVRERDEARDTAARLAVERNALVEQRDAALKALGE